MTLALVAFLLQATGSELVESCHEFYDSNDRRLIAALKRVLGLFLNLETRPKTPYNAIVTLPNVISFTRGFVCGPLLVRFAGTDHWAIIAAIYFWAAASDHLDGSLARLLGSTLSGVISDFFNDRIFLFFWVWAY